jgi:hypothetical protein
LGPGLGFGGEPLAFPPGVAAVRDHPGDDGGANHVGHHLGDGQRGAGRGRLDDDDPGGRLGQVRDAPHHGVEPEGVTEAGPLPEGFEVAPLRGVGADELDGEPVDQRAAGPERAEAQEPEHCGGHRALDQHQPRIAAQQPENGADRDAGQDQDADRVRAPVTDQADEHAEGGQGATQDERGHRTLPGRAQQ